MRCHSVTQAVGEARGTLRRRCGAGPVGIDPAQFHVRDHEVATLGEPSDTYYRALARMLNVSDTYA